MFEGLRSLNLVIAVLAVAMALYHLAYTQFLFQGPIRHQTTHLIFALLIVYLDLLRRKSRRWPILVTLMAASIITTGYIWFCYEALELRMGIPNLTDVIIGSILVVIVFDAVIRSFGKTLPIISGLFIAYTFFGQYLPQPFWHFPVTLKAAISQYDIGLRGMFGLALGVSANYVFLFMLFGALLSASGANKFFAQLGTLAGRNVAGGPAMSAVVSSALVGTISGSGMANVAITGQFTIPLMKKAGYKPEQAAAIESVASTGGSIMPPVMGIVAFIMSEHIGVPYVQVCAMSIIPALLYYFSIGAFVQLSAMKLGITPLTEKIDRRTIMVMGPLFVVPLLVIIILLILGFTPMYAAYAGIIAVILLALARKETRGSWKNWVRACIEGAGVGAKVGVVSALIGIIISSVTLTGLGLKFPSMVETLAGETLWIALLLVALMTLLLGCGLPPFASYLLVAILCIPALTKLGVPLIQANFFVFFFAVFALITPPVGLCCVVAAPMAGADYLKVGVESVKAGIIAWFLPFLAIWAPGIILQEEDLLLLVTQVIASMAAVLLLQSLLVGYFLIRLSVPPRIVSLIAASSLIAFVVSGAYVLLAAGLLVGGLFTLWQVRRRGHERNVLRGGDVKRKEFS